MSVLKSCGRFPWTEPTLGEEIINLTKKGVDVPTVERMYRKYINLSANIEATMACAEYCKADAKITAKIFSTMFGTNSILPNDIAVGDRIEIPLGDLGTFTATVQMVKDDKVLFLFDDYIVKRPMNENGSNEGGYEKSDLKKWIENDLFKMFPEVLRNHMTGLTIPTLGEICGWSDNWDKEHIEPDYDGRLPLMKQRRNRVAYYNNDCAWGWLRNSIKKEFFSDAFVGVNKYGNPGYASASGSYGVRPEFWLVG